MDGTLRSAILPTLGIFGVPLTTAVPLSAVRAKNFVIKPSVPGFWQGESPGERMVELRRRDEESDFG